MDYPTKKYRFKVVYELLSIRYNSRIKIQTYTNELLSLESCEKLFPAAGWYECEIWDMFGIFVRMPIRVVCTHAAGHRPGPSEQPSI